MKIFEAAACSYLPSPARLVLHILFAYENKSRNTVVYIKTHFSWGVVVDVEDISEFRSTKLVCIRSEIKSYLNRKARVR